MPTEPQHPPQPEPDSHAAFATRPPPRLSTLILLAALSILPVNVFLPSLASIAADFEADYALVALSLAGYAAAVAVLQLLMGPLSDRFGRRPIVLVGLLIFIVASIGCALAGDIWSFLAFRLLQAAIASGYVVSLAVIRDTTDRRQTASRFGYVTMAWAAAPMLGPTFGGVLDEAFGWRTTFWCLAIAGVIMLGVCWRWFGETNTHRANTIGQQFRAYPQLLRADRFWGYAICIALSTGAFYAFLAGAPLAATAAFEMSPATLGFFMGTITAGFMFGSFLSGRYASRFALTTMMISGRLVACAGLALGLILFLSGVDHVMALFGPCMVYGLGNGLTLPSANSGALSVRPDLAGSAGGLAGATAVATGAAIASLTGAILTEANAVHGLLSIMLVTTIVALMSALYVRMRDRRDKTLLAQ